MTAAGSVASPARLANAAQRTVPLPGGGEYGTIATVIGPISRDNPPALGSHPWDTGTEVSPNYIVDKQFRFANTAGITEGQIPVPYNPTLSRTLSTSGAAKPSAPLSFSTKTYPNASERREFHASAQRFPNESAAPGQGMWLVSNPYYPGNLPSQLGRGQAPPGQGPVQRGQSGVINPFASVGRGMQAAWQNAQTRLAPAISYSSITPTLNANVFTAAAMGGG